ncbi:hypothetical protein Tco_0498708 [Tanacetum coccineum]
MSIDEELAKKLDEREEVAAKEAHDIDWSDPSMLRYHALQNRPFSVVELEDDAEKEELQVYLNIVPEEESLDVESLAIKYPIVDWETQILANDKYYYQIKRADGSVKHYKIFSAMIYDFDRKGLLGTNLQLLVQELSTAQHITTNCSAEVNAASENMPQVTTASEYQVNAGKILVGNAATRKTLNLLTVKQYEKLHCSKHKEALIKLLIGVQKLVSQFGLLDEKKLSQEDVKQKLLRSLYTRVEHTAVVWRNKADYGYKDHGDLYNQPQVIKARGTPNYQLMASSSSRPDSQEIADNCKKGLGYENYNAVPPPYTGNFMPPTPDLSFTCLDEFVNEPVVENCKAMSSEEEPKVVRKYNDALSIEEWVSDDKEEDVSQPKNEKKSVRPSIIKKEFVKSKQQEKTARKIVKQVHIQIILQVQSQVKCRSTRKGIEPVQRLHLLPLWTCLSTYSQDLKRFSHNDGFELQVIWKKVDEDPRKKVNVKIQVEKDNVNSTNNVNTVSSTVNVDGTNKVNVVGGKTSIELPFDLNMPALKDDSIFNFTRDDEDDGVVADMNNLDTTIQVSPNLTTRIHKDHPFDQVIKDLQSATQTRKMSKNLEEHGFEETQKVNHAVEDQAGYRLAGRVSTIQVTRSLDFMEYKEGKLTRPYSLKGTKIISMETLTFFWDRQVKQRRWHIYLVKINNVAKDLRKFGFTEVKTTSTPMETQKPAASKIRWVKKVDVPIYQVNLKVSHLYAVKRIFRYLKGQLKLGLWYPKDSPFDLVAYTDSDYVGASLDRKSTIRGYQFHGCRLISWQCKKQTVVANSTTEAKYVATSS